MNLPANSTLLFIGDSITDCGRSPSGEASPWEPQHGLGHGYVSMVYAWLGAARPDISIRVVNKGTSGHTVRDLAGRWDKDVVAERPDTLCVMIGINDVWRQFDTPKQRNLGVGPEEYRETLTKLIGAAAPHVKAIHLATPFFIEPNRKDPMRARMDEYGQIVRDLAAAHEASFVDIQGSFDHALAYIHPTSLAGDRIHPGPVGHMIIARAFLGAFDCL